MSTGIGTALTSDPSSPRRIRSAKGPDGREARLPSATATWRLCLLGAWLLLGPEGHLVLGLNSQRLLALLAIAGPCDRTYLAGVMWPESRQQVAQANLRATLSRLQRRASRDLVHVHNRSLSLSPAVQVDTDDLVAIAAAALTRDLAPPYWQALTLLSCPDLLVGWGDEWVLNERERLRQLRLHALEALADHLVQVGNLAAAVEAALEAVAAEPLRESAHRVLIRAHLAEGNRSEAVRQFARLRQLLEEELGVRPSRLATDLLR